MELGIFSSDIVTVERKMVCYVVLGFLWCQELFLKDINVLPKLIENDERFPVDELHKLRKPDPENKDGIDTENDDEEDADNADDQDNDDVDDDDDGYSGFNSIKYDFYCEIGGFQLFYWAQPPLSPQVTSRTLFLGSCEVICLELESNHCILRIMVGAFLQQ
ncbi:uncharacterized protein LOC132277368 isoform X4 [Cornus florida]|uniref:uncharacterized protein LOC132277368 isoform X4 n=1 Tax=Cornus florida TaxID=4283 RepID=UPI0028A0E8BB|nr:uncharacterized protein LOC132277368 isoform X4 [Cornus florida]